jgi:TPR repeat protein
MYNLGLCFQCGHGVRASRERAFEWFARAARKGHAEAAVRCGRLVDAGAGGGSSFSWFQRAATLGHAEGDLGVAYSLLTGEGARKDARRALSLLNRAAQRGSSGAMYNLGVMFLDGNGVPHSKRKARMWLCRAAINGEKSARDVLRRHFK